MEQSGTLANKKVNFINLFIFSSTFQMEIHHYRVKWLFYCILESKVKTPRQSK